MIVDASFLPKALAADVRVCLGTDSTHASLWREAKHFVSIGASNEEATLAATKHSAHLLGLADEIGTLEEGKRADIIAVRGDPLRDILASREIGLVMKDGARYANLP